MKSLRGTAQNRKSFTGTSQLLLFVIVVVTVQGHLSGRAWAVHLNYCYLLLLLFKGTFKEKFKRYSAKVLSKQEKTQAVSIGQMPNPHWYNILSIFQRVVSGCHNLRKMAFFCFFLIVPKNWTYLIFVIFYTWTYFAAWKFYTLCEIATKLHCNKTLYRLKTPCRFIHWI